MKIIAEIGFNHDGDMEKAVSMIHAAADSGAQVVKFQTFKARDLVLPDSPHVDIVKAGEMDVAQHRFLKATADECGVEFMSTPFSFQSVDILEDVGVGVYKIASMDLTNLPLLKYIAETGKPVILSTGMAVLHEIGKALDVLESNGTGGVSLLHCLSQYPANACDLHLSVLPLLRDTFGVPVGYSDHYPGITACLAAYVHGAEIIETHFTLDTATPGGDHAHSADPHMLRHLVDSIALFETMKGDGRTFFRNRPDRENATLFRRGIHAARDIQAGETVTAQDLLFCRPEQELGPGDADWVVGLQARTDIKACTPIRRAAFKGVGNEQG